MPNGNNVQNLRTKLIQQVGDIYSITSDSAILLPLQTF
jgi:hypothetical protein